MFSQTILSSNITWLLNSKCFDTSILIVFYLRLKNIHSATIQPFITPLFKIKIWTHWCITWLIICPCNAVNKIIKNCVLPRILFKILMETFLIYFMTGDFVNLFQESSSFTIWNSIKNSFSYLGVFDGVCLDGMCRTQYISSDTPTILCIKSCPCFLICVFQIRVSSHQLKGLESCKWFIQPKIIPPSHCYQVTKPHMW